MFFPTTKYNPYRSNGKVDNINFACAAVTIIDDKLHGCQIRARIHMTMADPTISKLVSMPSIDKTEETSEENKS